MSGSEQLNDIETPDFTKLQEYKLGIGELWIGIDMEYAWSLGVAGKGIRIADIEAAFNYENINLKRDNFIPLVVSDDDDEDEDEINHGTAVAGIMYAKDLGFGVTGMVHDADALYGISIKPYDPAGGIIRGLQHLRAGDILFTNYLSNPNQMMIQLKYLLIIANRSGISLKQPLMPVLLLLRQVMAVKIWMMIIMHNIAIALITALFGLVLALKIKYVVHF